MSYIQKEQRSIKGIDTSTNPFWDRVHAINDPGSCWKWFGPKANGYGIYSVCGTRIRANRFVWQLVKSTIPDGLVVMHTCDNPNCVRPSHLVLGTRADNRRDCVKKHRHTQGTSVWKAKLDPAKVLVVRTLYSSGEHTQAEIAALLGITQPAVSYVVNNVNWKQVPPA